MLNGAAKLLACLAAAPLLSAQSDMREAWDQLLGSAPAAPHRIDWFKGFYFESRTTYERYQTAFTGNPTETGVINAPNNGVFNPAGIPSPEAFQPDSNRVQDFIDFGTRGDTVQTHFALRYRQDLTHTDIGSPAENITETFYGNRLYEFLEGMVEVKLPSAGSLQMGRLNVYGAELASLDGAAWSVAKPKYDFTIYAGRRFSFFSDPKQRALGGANLNLKLSPTLSVELQTLWYVKGTNRAVVRKRLRDRWLVTSSLRAYGGSPVDFSAGALYSSRSGRDSLRAAFFQKLTDKDYSFDYTSDARDLAAKNPLYRLYLGPVAQYSQFSVEAHHQFLSNLRAGAAATVRRLNDRNDEGPFDTSFEDYRFNGQYFPWRRIETFFEYHQRNSDRLSPLGTVELSDLRATGENGVKDLTGEIRRSFGEGRLNLAAAFITGGSACRIVFTT